MDARQTHTPTPWEACEVRTQCGRAFRIGAGEMLTAGKGSCIIYDDYPGNPDNERSANAAFIVKAVNSHDTMVEALEAFADPSNWVVNGRFDPSSGNFDATTFARAALKATGG